MNRAEKLPTWLVVSGLGITQIIGWGTTYYALGALSPDIGTSTGWSKTLIFGAFSAALLFSSLISRSCGRLVDNLGGRKAMVIGSLFSAAGCLMLGLSALPWVYVLGWLLLAPAMRLATYDAAFASLSQVEGEKTRISISYLSLFGGLASTAFWPLGHALAGRFGWQNTFLIYALLHLLVCLPIHAVLLRGATGKRAKAAESTQANLTGRNRTFAMAAFATVLALNSLVFSAISAHVLPLFTGLGLSASQAVTLAALIGPSQVASRVAEIVVGRFWTANVLGLIAFGLLPLALLLAIGGQFSFLSLGLFVLVYGASNGLVTIAKGACALSLFGPANYGQTLGTISTPSLLLGAMAPLAMAWVLSQWGPHAAMYIGLLAGTASTGIMLWLALRFRQGRVQL